MLKIIETLTTDDYLETLEIKVYKGTKVLISIKFHDGEPEDNSIARNFNDVRSITDLMQIAYDAGKAGEEIVFEFESLKAEER